MAGIYMTRTPQNPGNSNTVAPYPGTGPWQYYSVTYSSGTNQTPVYFPDVNGCSVNLAISSGTAKIQLTNSPPDRIEAGTANWVDWAAGSVTASTVPTIIAGPSAIRVVLSSGSVTLEVRA